MPVRDSEGTMANSTLQLAALPVELLHCVFRQLDPVALITTSQTCTYFRSIIMPARKHFAERLLALEIESEHGGPALTYFARGNRLEPDWNEDAWDHMRWACTHCLRLLRHAAFDNRSLLRLKNRKPASGSPAAKRFSGVTSWEPVESRALSAKEERRKRVLVAEEKEQEKLLRKQYHIATTKTLNVARSRYTSQSRTSFLRAAELEEALELSDSQLDSLTEGQEHALLDRAALHIEEIRAGSHRFSRKCNECRFQLGRFKQTPFIKRRRQRPGHPDELTWAVNNNKGTPEVPLVRSRRLKFTTPFDRYFPHIEQYMSTGRPSFILPLRRIYREDDTYMANTLYIARCPSCATWQELRAFRWAPRGWGYGEFIGVGCWMTEAEFAAHSEEVNNMQCNKCVQNKLGDALLAEQLSAFMSARLETECRAVLGMLSGGWITLRHSSTKPLHRSPMKQLLQSLEAAQKNFAMVKRNEDWSDIDVDADDVEDNLAVMKRRRLEWLQLSMEEQDLANDCIHQSKPFGVWHDGWDEAMEYWRWAKAWMEEIKKEPQRVVRWALERDTMKLN